MGGSFGCREKNPSKPVTLNFSKVAKQTMKGQQQTVDGAVSSLLIRQPVAFRRQCAAVVPEPAIKQLALVTDVDGSHS